MGKQKHTENDEIEIRLVHYVGRFFHLQWRYKDTHKVLGFNVHDRWKYITIYDMNWDEGDIYGPENDFYWKTPSFDLSDNSDVQKYESIKKKINTKKDLWDWYNINHRIEKYFDDLRRYAEMQDRLEQNKEKYAK